MNVATAAGVVEQMLGHAAAGRWDRLDEVLAEDFEIAEPDSLPYGGVHRGREAYVALMQRIGELFELSFEPEGLDQVDDSTVLLRMHVTFDPRHGGHAVRLPVVEVLTVRELRVERSQVFLDTAALLAASGLGRA